MATGLLSQALLSAGTIIALIIVLVIVIIYKRRKLQRRNKIRDAEANEVRLEDIQRSWRQRGVHRADAEDPALPVYQRKDPQEAAEHLSKLNAEIQRLESLPEPLDIEQQVLLADLKNDAAHLREQANNQIQAPPPVYIAP